MLKIPKDSVKALNNLLPSINTRTRNKNIELTNNTVIILLRDIFKMIITNKIKIELIPMMFISILFLLYNLVYS